MMQWHYQLKKQNWPICELITKFASNTKVTGPFEKRAPGLPTLWLYIQELK